MNGRPLPGAEKTHNLPSISRAKTKQQQQKFPKKEKPIVNKELIISLKETIQLYYITVYI